MTLTDVLIDFSLISLLLVVSAWLRRKIKPLQMYYIPVALIAGVLGILLGPDVLGQVSPVCISFSSSIGQWAGVLSAIIFSCSFLGLKLEKVSGPALQTYFLAGTIHQAQVIVGLTVTAVLGLVFADLKFGFGILPVLGFYGGHSMAIAGGTIFDEAGYMTNGAQVGATFGTIGMLCGHLLRTGLIKINSFFTNLPLFACCLIFSAIFCIFTQNMPRINQHIDRKTVVRISGAALEYMIASSIATTSLSVFTAYAVPLVVVSVCVAVVTYVACFILSKWVLPKEDRFETSVGLFGQCNGVLATGLLLLKVVDPEFETNAATNITSSSTLGYTYQLQYTLVFVALCMTKPLFVYLWSWLLFIVLFGAGVFFGRKYRRA